MKIKIGADCGNSPKREFIKELNIAFANIDIDFLMDSVTDDIRWIMVGDRIIEGKDQFNTEIKEMAKNITLELGIDRIVTHGKEGAACGIIKMENGKSYQFGDFYEFSNTKGTKIRSITSYVIEEKNGEDQP